MSDAPPIRVLLVEDEPHIRQQQERLLRLHDSIEVVGTASSGEEALTLLDETRPDVLLLDLGLPGIDGIEVTKRVKASHPDIEIMIFTIFDGEDRVLAAIRAGAAGYLLKGVPVAKMVEGLHDVAAGGSVIQPHLARYILRHFKEERPAVKGAPPAEPSPLTKRENEILQVIAKGLSNREVAHALGLSMATVRTHLEHIYTKLDVTNSTEAVTEGIRNGYIPID